MTSTVFAPRLEDREIDPTKAQVEGWLDHESRWWVMPYNFPTSADAYDFMQEPTTPLMKHLRRVIN